MDEEKTSAALIQENVRESRDTVQNLVKMPCHFSQYCKLVYLIKTHVKIEFLKLKDSLKSEI